LRKDGERAQLFPPLFIVFFVFLYSRFSFTFFSGGLLFVVELWDSMELFLLIVGHFSREGTREGGEGSAEEGFANAFYVRIYHAGFSGNVSREYTEQ
jgi:hypothetical protein